MPAEFKEAYAQFVEGGWPQLRADPEHGGQGAPIVLGTAVEELWASANLAFKLCPMLTQGAIEAIERCGTDEQKRKYLPKMVSGEWTGTMNLTEPQAGSDLGAIRTRAVPEGEHYRLFGQKIFITYGDHDYTPNIIHMVLARIEGAPAGTRGISLFIVPKVLVNDDGSLGERNDVRCVSIEHKLGIHASPTCVLCYGDREGAVGYLVGEANRGLEYMFIMMNAARLSVGLEGYSLAERAYQQALELARTRVQGRPAGAPHGGRQAGADRLSRRHQAHAADDEVADRCSARDRAVRALQLDLARHRSRRGRARSRAGARRSADSDHQGLVDRARSAADVARHSGARRHGLHRRDRRCTVSARRAHRDDLRRHDRHSGERSRRPQSRPRRRRRDERSYRGHARGAASPAADDATVQRVPGRGDQAIELARRTRRRASCRRTKNGPEHVQAIAVPYLMLCGVVIGGWLMARTHEIASRKATEDREFYAGKQQIARFYLQQVLPESIALAQIVTTGGASVVEADAGVL